MFKLLNKIGATTKATAIGIGMGVVTLAVGIGIVFNAMDDSGLRIPTADSGVAYTASQYGSGQQQYGSTFASGASGSMEALRAANAGQVVGGAAAKTEGGKDAAGAVNPSLKDTVAGDVQGKAQAGTINAADPNSPQAKAAAAQQAEANKSRLAAQAQIDAMMATLPQSARDSAAASGVPATPEEAEALTKANLAKLSEAGATFGGAPAGFSAGSSAFGGSGTFGGGGAITGGGGAAQYAANNTSGVSNVGAGTNFGPVEENTSRARQGRISDAGKGAGGIGRGGSGGLGGGARGGGRGALDDLQGIRSDSTTVARNASNQSAGAFTDIYDGGRVQGESAIIEDQAVIGVVGAGDTPGLKSTDYNRDIGGSNNNYNSECTDPSCLAESEKAENKKASDAISTFLTMMVASTAMIAAGRYLLQGTPDPFTKIAAAVLIAGGLLMGALAIVNLWNAVGHGDVHNVYKVIAGIATGLGAGAMAVAFIMPGEGIKLGASIGVGTAAGLKVIYEAMKPSIDENRQEKIDEDAAKAKEEADAAEAAAKSGGDA